MSDGHSFLRTGMSQCHFQSCAEQPQLPQADTSSVKPAWYSWLLGRRNGLHPRFESIPGQK